jgi:hypothetical protein
MEVKDWEEARQGVLGVIMYCFSAGQSWRSENVLEVQKYKRNREIKTVEERHNC